MCDTKVVAHEPRLEPRAVTPHSTHPRHPTTSHVLISSRCWYLVGENVVIGAPTAVIGARKRRDMRADRRVARLAVPAPRRRRLPRCLTS